MGGFVALGWPFTVEVDDPVQAAYLAELLAAFATPVPGPAAHAYVRSSRPGGWDLTLDGEPVTSGATFAGFVTALVHDLNRRVITASGLLALHAGGVEVDGVTVVLPGHIEAGKSTLTAGLVRAGAGYLSDEAVAVEWDGLRTVPYPKPLSIDAGAQALFPELDPRAGLGVDGPLDQWQVAPARIRADGLGRGGAAPTVIVFPRYEAGAYTLLEPVRGGEVLVELAKNTFRFNEQGRRALDALAQLLRGAQAYRLVSGDLARSVDAVLGVARQSRA